MRKRKNPIIHNIDNVKYILTDKPNYDESAFIRKFAKIIDHKFIRIKKNLPIINFIDLGRGELGFYENKELQINAKMYYDEYFQYFHTLFHELGHFLWEDYLSLSVRIYFIEYIKKFTKNLSTKALNNILLKYDDEAIKIKFPLIHILLSGLIETKDYGSWITKNVSNFDFRKYFHGLVQRKSHIRMFTKPVTSYMPDTIYYYEEIFCEIFGYYMLYGKKALNDDNYRILKSMIPELI